MTARDPAASRNMVEKAAGNKNPDAPSKSTENFKAGVNSQPRGLAEVMHYSLSPDAAAGLWEIATDFGISPVAYERLLKRWMQDPEFIPIVNSISSEPERAVMWLRRNANEEILWLYSSDGAASASETVALWGLPSSALVLRLYEKCMHTFLLNAEFDEESYESRERMFQLILPKLIDHVLEHEGEHELITNFSDILRDPAFGNVMARMLVTMTSAPQEISQKASFDQIDEDLILSTFSNTDAVELMVKDVPSGIKKDVLRITENSMLNPQLISLMNSAMQSGDYSAVDQLQTELIDEQVKSMCESLSAVFTDNMLACLSSSQFGADVATYAAATDQTGIMDPAAVMNIVDKLTQDPRIFAAMISVVRKADGSPYGSYISGMAHVMMPDIISQLEQNVDGPGSGAAGTSVDSSRVTTWPHTLVMLQVFEGALDHHARAAGREGWGDQSFEIDPSNVLAEIYSTVSHNALDFEDPAGYRIMWRQCMRNPEIIACMNSMVWTAGELGSGFSRLTMLMMPYFLSYLDQIKYGAGSGQDAFGTCAPGTSASSQVLDEQDAARARAAGIEGWGDPGFELDPKSLMAEVDNMLAVADNAVGCEDPVGYRNMMEQCMQNPEVIACMNSMVRNAGESGSGSSISRLMRVMGSDLLSYMDQQMYGAASGQGASANVAGNKHPGDVQNSGAGASFEPLPEVYH